MEHDWLQQRVGKLDEQLEALERDIKAAEADHLAAVASGQPEPVADALKARLDRLVEKEKVVLQQRGELQAQIIGLLVSTPALCMALLMQLLCAA
jgi:hypothetical protein